MKILLLLLLIIPSLSFAAILNSNEKGNGGDSCEIKIESIIADLKLWLNNDLHLNLKLSENLSDNEYKEKMLKSIEQTNFRCSNSIADIVPTNLCSLKNNELECLHDSFLNLNQLQSYRLIHQYLAKISRIEEFKHEQSTLPISDQIPSFITSKGLMSLNTISKNSKLNISYSFTANFAEKDVCGWALYIAKHRSDKICNSLNANCVVLDNIISPVKINQLSPSTCNVELVTIITDIKKNTNPTTFVYQKNFQGKGNDLLKFCEKSRKSILSESMEKCLEAGSNQCYYIDSKIIDAGAKIINGAKKLNCTIEIYRTNL